MAARPSLGRGAAVAFSLLVAAALLGSLALASSEAAHRDFHQESHSDSSSPHSCLACLLQKGLVESADAAGPVPGPVPVLRVHDPAVPTRVFAPNYIPHPTRGPPFA